VSKNKQLASRIAGVLAVAALVGTSAFAESRPANGTRSRAVARDTSSRGRAAAGSVSRRGDASTSRGTASGSTIDRSAIRGGDARFDRGNDTVAPRTDDRSTRDNRSNDTYQNRSTRGGNGSYRNGGNGSSRSGGNDTYRNGGNGTYRNGGNGTYRNGGNGTYRNGGNNRGSYGNRQPYYGQGRVSRVNRYGSGYRVWIIGSPYPFFIPEAYYRSNRFRIGLSIRLGGYYNPLGYYDYYDGYNDGYYNNGYSRGELRGVVESVDYRRDTFVIRNEATGSFVTVVLRDRRDNVRTGDFVEVSGDWTRNGLFEAYDVDQLDYDRDYRR
jgi:hypothetical protein